MGEERDEREETSEPERPADQTPVEEARPDDVDAVDAAKLSDEAAAEAARRFLGPAEPEEQVSVEEAKSALRRAGAVAEVEPEAAPPLEPEPAPVAVAPAAAEGVDTGRRWYVIHTYSGYENKVKTNLEHRISSMDMGDKIFQVLVPTEEEIEIKNGKRHPVERKVFPGYVLVEMIMGDDSWYVVRNPPGVTSFVGSGNKPTPLTDGEVRDPPPDQARRPQVQGRVHEGRGRAGHRRSVHRSSRSRRRGEPRAEQGEGPRLDLRPRDPGGAGLPANREAGEVGRGMAKKIKAVVKGQINAGKATAAPPVGTALGPHGINMGQFIKEYNERTASLAGTIVPAVVTVFEDRTYTFVTKSPPAADLIRKEAGIEKGSGNPNKNKVGKITRAKVRSIAEIKMNDLNANTIESAMRMVEGTARSMGVEISG